MAARSVARRQHARGLEPERILRDAAGALPSTVELHAGDVLARPVAAAQAEGTPRPDVTVHDLTLLLGTAPGGETPRPHRERWVTLALHALS